MAVFRRSAFCSFRLLLFGCVGDAGNQRWRTGWREATIGGECFLLPILFFWLLLDYLPIVFANLIFATLTIYYVPFRRRLTLPRALMSVASAAIPIHFLATTLRQVYIGAHLWLLAFVLSIVAHWTQFFLTVELNHDATVTGGFSDSKAK